MQDFLRWINHTGLNNIVWITDVDETLLEKSQNPDLVTEVPGLENICEQLDRKAGGGFFIITGRELAWLDKVFPNKNIRASCEYHCLFRREPGEVPKILNPVPEWSLIDSELDALAAQYEGLRMRKKPFMRSLHYIGIPEEKRDDIRKKLEPQLKAILDKHNLATGQIVGLIDGGKVFDMGPGNSDKGHALMDVLQYAEQKTGRKLIPVYFGDSPGDLPAARETQHAGGKFISVGGDARVTAVADFKFCDPAMYRDAIRAVLGAVYRPAPTAIIKPGLP